MRILVTSDIKPLSVNAAWQGKRFRTDEYKKYQRDLVLSFGRPGKVKGDVAVEVEARLLKKVYSRTDADNLLKPILDALTTCGLIEDDRKVVDLRVRKVLADRYRISVSIQKAR